MGIEYRIRFDVPPDFSAELLTKRLPDPRIVNSDWTEYGYKVEKDGFYFVDHGGTPAIAAVAFRCLVDEGLRHAQRVVVETL